MISFKSGQKVAIICGGEYNDKSVYINTDIKETDRNLNEENIYDIVEDKEFNRNKFKRLSVKDRSLLTKALMCKIEPLDELLCEKYNNISKKIDNSLKRELKLETGVMVIIPSYPETERIYMTGKQGSGKSTLCALYMMEYSCLFPKRQIFLFTKHEGEKAYKLIKHREILYTSELLQEPLDITLLANSLVVFDDCDNIQDKKIQKNLNALNDDLVTSGRKYGIHVISMSHQMMNYAATRNTINEANKTIWFQSSNKYHVNRYLKVYASLDPKTIQKINSLSSRWICLSNSVPQYVLHEHGIFLV